jgi:hypothetical protein
MVRYLRDNFYRLPGLQLQDSVIPDFRTPHDVDPPEQNPFNSPNWPPVVTENPSGQGQVGLGGGLLGMLRALLQQSLEPGAVSSSAPNAPENHPDGDGSAQRSVIEKLLGLRGEQGSNSAEPSQETSGSPQKPCRCLARRSAG